MQAIGISTKSEKAGNQKKSRKSEKVGNRTKWEIEKKKKIEKKGNPKKVGSQNCSK